MHNSVDRILISHVGSLPRGDDLGDMLIEDEAGRPMDKRKLEELIEDRVAHVLTKQREAGVDIANDGEQGRVGFQTYLPQRMSGFGGASKRPYAKEFIEFPLFTKKMLNSGSHCNTTRFGSIQNRSHHRGERHHPGKRIVRLAFVLRAIGGHRNADEITRLLRRKRGVPDDSHRCRRWW